MSTPGTVVIAGGTTSLGKALGKHYADRGFPVALSSRDQGRADAAAAEIGGNSWGIAMDLTDPHTIRPALEGIDDVQYVVVAALYRDGMTIKDYDIDESMKLVTIKLIGYPEVCHVLAPRMRQDGSILFFGGNATMKPYPGSTNVTAVNGAVMTFVRTLSMELAPIRVNAIHPAIVGDSPFWADKPAEVLEMHRQRTTTGRLVTTDDVTNACVFLLESPAIAGINLWVDAGTNV